MSRIIRLLAAASFAASSAPLFAQAMPDAGSVEATAETLGVAPTPPQSPFQPFEDRGVTLLLSYTGEAATNPSGGVRQGAAYAGQIFAGADFDISRIAGIEGGTVHLAVTNRHGRNLAADTIGTSTSVQEIYGTQNTHLAILTWQQTLLGGRLEIEAGRTVANISFLNSPLYCNFQSNSACGNPTFIFKVSNFTYFPASSWGAHAKVHLTDKIYAHGGVYEVNPRRKRPEDNGFTFSTKGATGAVMPFELGYGTDFSNDRLPRNYQIGGWTDRGDYADPLHDEHGGLAVLTGRPQATRKGRSGIFVRFDQMIWRPDPGSERGLTVFGVAMKNLSGRVIQDNFLEAGAVLTGTFNGRDRDTFGFVINRQRFSDLAVANVRAARLSAGGDGNVPRHQYMMELAYGAQIGAALRVSPNIQYIVNPDQLSDPFRTRNALNALVLGFKFTLDAPSFLSRR